MSPTHDPTEHEDEREDRAREIRIEHDHVAAHLRFSPKSPAELATSCSHGGLAAALADDLESQAWAGLLNDDAPPGRYVPMTAAEELEWIEEQREKASSQGEPLDDEEGTTTAETRR